MALVSQAQPIRYASDAAPIIAQMDSTLTIKQYEGAFGDSYSYTFTADTIKRTLLKAVVQDKPSRSTRTYYFHNEYLVKVIERFEHAGEVSTSLHFFLQPDYALSVDYKDNFQKELIVRQRLQNDAYKFLLHYRKLSQQ